MCGRYTIIYTDDFARYFDLPYMIEFESRYNLRPSEQAPVIRTINGERRLDLMSFGFRPQWMTDSYIKEKKRRPYINTRAETVFDSSAFRDAARHSRCLIPVSGFYEPKGKTKPRPQYYFQMPDARPFALAGIWTERSINDAELAYSFAILTTEANQTMAPIHERMPAIIHPDSYTQWLDMSVSSVMLKPLLVPWKGEDLQCWQVSDYVNKRDSEGPACIQPHQTTGQLL